MSDLNSLSTEEIQRYSRHILIPEVGQEGQEKLKKSSVLIIGAGGLGSPAAMYLAAAGVGKIGLVDYDVVELSNLQRQVIHGNQDLGKSKVDSAKKALQEINPLIEIVAYETTFSSDNGLTIAADYDLIVDGSDNFPSRYLISDVCVNLGLPHIFASVYRFDGQASVFDHASGGPCYRCVFPDPPEPGSVPNCAEGGVLGILPGIMGSIQASEAIKSLLGIGKNLSGRLLLFNALDMQFDFVNLRKNPNCVVCSLSPEDIQLIDYEAFCGVNPVVINSPIPNKDIEVNVKDLAEEIKSGQEITLLDVRETQEVDISKLDNSFLIPLGDLPERINELNPDDNIVVYCRSGARSDQAMRFLRNAGFTQVRNLLGGINDWARHIDQNLPIY